MSILTGPEFPKILTARRTWKNQQPTYLPEINRFNPITEGLVVAIHNINGVPKDACNYQNEPSYFGTVTRGITNYGVGIDTSVVNSAVEFPAPPLTSSWYTLLSLVHRKGTHTDIGAILTLSYNDNSDVSPYVIVAMKYESNTANNSVNINYQSSGSSLTAYGSNSSAGSLLSPLVYTSRFSPTYVTSSHYQNGIYLGGQANAVTFTPNFGSNRRIIVGEDYRHTRTANAVFPLSLMWHRYLSSSEIVSMSLNPWQIFKRRSLIAYFGNFVPGLSSPGFNTLGTTYAVPEVTWTY